MEMQEALNSQNNQEKKNKVRGFALLNFKI